MFCFQLPLPFSHHFECNIIEVFRMTSCYCSRIMFPDIFQSLRMTLFTTWRSATNMSCQIDQYVIQMNLWCSNTNLVDTCIILSPNTVHLLISYQTMIPMRIVCLRCHRHSYHTNVAHCYSQSPEAYKLIAMNHNATALSSSKNRDILVRGTVCMLVTASAPKTYTPCIHGKFAFTYSFLRVMLLTLPTRPDSLAQLLVTGWAYRWYR